MAPLKVHSLLILFDLHRFTVSSDFVFLFIENASLKGYQCQLIVFSILLVIVKYDRSSVII